MANYKKIDISPELQKLIDYIDTFKASWQQLSHLVPEQLKALRHVATIESVGSSTRIEGSKLSDREVERILSGLKTESFKSRDEQEVAGYAYVMEEIFTSYPYIPLTENYIKQLHTLLLQYSTKDERHRGEYKKFPNHVEAFDTQGKSLGVVFETISPFDTPFRMADLIHWTQHAFDAQEIHPLVIIGIFIVTFLAIHPFQDGNGRLSRVLTTLLLLKCGYLYVPYSSLETIVEHTKEGYYRALRLTQATLKTEKHNFQPWLLYFLRSLGKQIERLEFKINQEQITRISLPKLAIDIIQLVQDKGQIAMADIIASTGAPRSTIKKQLATLVDQKYLARHGQGRAVWYTRAQRV
ncbi:MAG TPA: Fic family protein [Candidatus Babeliales bacterium]|nr:Fic family protein [Candidatus Babeliales bacterium]